MQMYKLTTRQIALLITVLIAAASVSICIVIHAPRSADKTPQLWAAESTSVVQTGYQISPAKTDISIVQSVQTSQPDVAAAPLPAAVPELKSWEMGNVKAETPRIPLNEKIADYAIVQLEQNPAQFPAVGERILLPMLNGKSVVATVESSTKNPNGDYSWSGHLEGYGNDYPVVMTYGEHSIFATITTPEGSYTMESVNGLGWLYKNPAEIELSNPGAKDFLDIAEPH